MPWIAWPIKAVSALASGEIRATSSVKMPCVSAAQRVLCEQRKREEMSWSVNSNNTAVSPRSRPWDEDACAGDTWRERSGRAWSGMGRPGGEKEEAPPECALGTRPLPAGVSGVNLACVLRLGTLSAPSLQSARLPLPSCTFGRSSSRTWGEPVKGITGAAGQGQSHAEQKRGCRNRCRGPRGLSAAPGPTARPSSLRSKLTCDDDAFYPLQQC